MIFGTRKKPKGPSIRSFYDRNINLSETKIDFRAPKHDLYLKEKKLDSYNIYNKSQYENWDIYGPDTLCLNIFNECWNFNGLPLLDPGVSDIRMVITLLKSDQFGSLFSPSNLLDFDNQNILYEFGPENKSHRYDTHIDWKAQKINNVDWVFYKSKSLTVSAISESIYTYITAIEDYIALGISFITTVHAKGTQFDTEASEFISEIMNSFSMKLSPTAIRNKNETLAKNPDSKYPESMPMIHWTEKLHSETVSEAKEKALAEELEKIKEELGI